MKSNKQSTLNIKRQLGCVYTADFFSGLRITDAVWVALLAARGFSLWEIGLAESVFHIVSLLCEVPSGMAADLLGRKKALVSGGVLAVTSNLLMAFAPNLFAICFAMALNALYNTLFSGTFTARTNTLRSPPTVPRSPCWPVRWVRWPARSSGSSASQAFICSAPCSRASPPSPADG